MKPRGLLAASVRAAQAAMSDGHDAVPMPGQDLVARNKAVRAVLSGLSELQATVFFEKSLTSSDASGSGRVVIPKARDLRSGSPRLRMAHAKADGAG